MSRNYGPVVCLAGDELVERAGVGGAPTAFRIWQAGGNPGDDGVDIFSPRSASLLLEEQDARGNLFSIDFDHLSLELDRPAEAGRAAGWHRLEVRLDAAGEPELWAVDVEWCVDAKAGLEEQPPRWRYFSPAFIRDEDTDEIISYLNTALCINPATWNNPQLATRSRGNEAMTDEDEKKMNDVHALAMDLGVSHKTLRAISRRAEAKFGDPDNDDEGKPKEENPTAQKRRARAVAAEQKDVESTVRRAMGLPVAPSSPRVVSVNGRRRMEMTPEERRTLRRAGGVR